MGAIRYPHKVKLIAAIMVSRPDLFSPVREEMASAFGPIDLESVPYPFSFTDYYSKEMGVALIKRIMSFARLTDKEALASAKRRTNEMEDSYASEEGGTRRRSVNIDPGYVSDSKLVLASTKNFSHRIYIGQGIFAEVTMRYLRTGGFTPLEWTYPDYQTGPVLTFLERVRERYMEQLKEG